MSKFLNPYGFVSIRRDNLGDLIGDHEPKGHDRARRDYVHGSIQITFEAVAPLLILDDTSRVLAQGTRDHFLYSVPRNVDGSIRIPLSGLLGALRSAYEAVTDSRFGAFSTHSKKLSYTQKSGTGRDRSFKKVFYDKSPSEITNPYLKPTSGKATPSAADRLFGYVSQDKASNSNSQAYRGCVRLVAVDTSDATCEDVGGAEGKPLAILGGPKPQQFRFYLGLNTTGGQISTPVEDRSDAFTARSQIRGRKFYWHHAGSVPSRENSAQWSATRRDNQNRSVREWIKVGSRFTLDIQIDDGEAYDVGALLWLLQAASGERPAHLRFGYGKPLGFGSVKVVDLKSSLLFSKQLCRKWISLGADDLVYNEPDEFISAFLFAIGAENGEESSFPSYVKEYLALGRGREGAKISYPKIRDDDKGFEWFQRNDRERPPQTLRSPTDRNPELESGEPPTNNRRPNGPGGHQRRR